MLKFIRASLVAAVVAGLLVAPGAASAMGGNTTTRPAPKKKPPTRSVPEISGAHAGAAFALVIGGVAVVLGRRRRKVA